MGDWTNVVLDFLGNPLTHAVLWTCAAFVLGSIIGSFANVCLVRWPLGLSVNHPPSHCFGCQKLIAWYDNLPLLSFLWLRGKCRHCQVGFSSRYFWIEFTFAAFFALFYVLEVVLNVRRAGLLPSSSYGYGLTPALVAIFGYHAFLLGTVLLHALLRWQGTWLPSVTYVPALVVGLVGGVLGPWPWPCPVQPNALESFRTMPLGAVTGLQPAPLWSPLPEFLEPDSYVLGLANVVAGIVAALFLMGTAKGAASRLGPLFHVSGNDLFLGAVLGAFVGWQGVVFVVVAGLPVWAATGPARSWLLRRNRFLPLGTWLGCWGLVYLIASRWILAIVGG